MAIWSAIDPLSPHQAAYLLCDQPPQPCGIIRDPLTEAVHEMLLRDCYSGALPCRSRDPGGLTDTDIRISRDALREWAERKGLHPTFLFPENRQPPDPDPDPRERATWTRLVKVLCLEAGIELSEPYKAAEVLIATAAKHGVVGFPKKPQTIAEKLKLVRDAD